ncbi:unnamed protein product [Arctia plantaginis]|uniref:Uncharacterized protein n=1 Tax=Arctia plantaginis TaxID=874455 RepID=A0A8S1BD63_ARCPL|nr:unnamed protein product [Arctia plantaginis]
MIKSRDVAFIEKYNDYVNVPIPCDTDVTVKESQSDSSSTAPSTSSGMPSVTQYQKMHTQESLEKESNGQTSKSEDSSEYDTDTGDLDETYYPPRCVSQDHDTNVTVRSLRRRDKQNNEDKENYMCFYTDLTDK